MPTVQERKRKCACCKRILTVEHFQSRKDSTKTRKRCRKCRSNKSYDRLDESQSNPQRSSLTAKSGLDVSGVDLESPPKRLETLTTSTAALRTDSGPKSKTSSTSESTIAASSSKSGSATSSPPAPASKASSRPSASLVIDALTSTRKTYSHSPLPGLSFSGPVDKTKNIQRQRRFLVPPGVVRIAHSSFPLLANPLEPGMVSHTPGCLECTLKGIHCTYGAGVRLNGKTRDPITGKCDYCLFTTRKCKGNGYEGYGREVTGLGTGLGVLLDSVEAHVDTCLRAGEEDKSLKVNAKRLIGKFNAVKEKLTSLEANLSSQPKSQRTQSGTDWTIPIVLD